MEGLKRFFGVVLILIGAIVAIHTIIEPIYHTSSSDHPYSRIWKIIDPLSAISIIVGLEFGYLRIRRTRENPSVKEFIAANALFYGFVFVAILFFWNWFGISKAAKDFTAVSADVRALVWTFFDALLPVLNGAMGIHLLRAKINRPTS